VKSVLQCWEEEKEEKKPVLPCAVSWWIWPGGGKKREKKKVGRTRYGEIMGEKKKKKKGKPGVDPTTERKKKRQEFVLSSFGVEKKRSNVIAAVKTVFSRERHRSYPPCAPADKRKNASIFARAVKRNPLRVRGKKKKHARQTGARDEKGVGRLRRGVLSITTRREILPRPVKKKTKGGLPNALLQRRRGVH